MKVGVAMDVDVDLDVNVEVVIDKDMDMDITSFREIMKIPNSTELAVTLSNKKLNAPTSAEYY
jgi:hypothetical protein